jgi:hypothetical protein
VRIAIPVVTSCQANELGSLEFTGEEISSTHCEGTGPVNCDIVGSHDRGIALSLEVFKSAMWHSGPEIQTLFGQLFPSC